MVNRYFGKKRIVLLQIFFPVFLFCQTKITDSLKNQINSLKAPDKKLSAIFLLCDQYSSLNPDTVLHYYKIGKALASNKNNDIIKLEFYNAIFLIKKGQLDSAERLIENSVALIRKTNDILLLRKFLSLQSNLLIKSNKQKESLENSFYLLQSAERTKDTLTQIKAKIYIGWAYMELDQSQQALNWFLDAVKLDNITHEKYSQPSLYSNIAAVYDDLHKRDSAEIFIKRSIQLSLRKNDLANLANAYNIFADINIHKKNNAAAEPLMQEGLRIRKLIGDPFYIVSDIYQLGVFYANNHQANEGIAVVKEGISIAEQYNLSAKLPILYAALGENYKSAGDMNKYSEVLNKIISLKDSTYKRNTAYALSEIQTKYEVQKKENTIIQQKLDLTRKNNVIYGALALLLSTVITSFFIIQNRRKNQQLRLQELVIDQKKRTTAAVMQAEENERKRIAEDLHDSVAQKMVVAKLNLEVFEGYLPALNEQQKHVFDNIFSLVNESVSEVRSLSHSMMPQALVTSGLTEAVKNFIDKIENKNLHITFDVEGTLDNIEKNKEIMIYSRR